MKNLSPSRLCKKHWNPIAAILVGACLGFAIAIPILDQMGENSLFYRWQSMIGAAVSAGLAIGLFQYQRHLDKQKEKKGYTFAVIRSLKRITNHYENVRIDMAKVTIENQRIRAAMPHFRPHRREDMQIVANAVAEIIMVYGKYSEILASIPRDHEIAGDIIADLDKIDDALGKTMNSFQSVRNTAATNWSENTADGTPLAIFDALQLLKDTAYQRETINTLLKQLQSNTL
ncbi:hypothetical protein ACFOY8_04435 [Thalassospira xianhensis]|uniref:Uncharacterized protein n=1 Tax=Thalassospira xianhensis MCCC 1A02616 TaxID=1177929 RepID=A0A367U652_9PROT|nr:hypothetical protein [Thalassospira xianhensis]RCK03767.1 hypothetical protein TH5_23570 [Thalassospira xianhensis MCCC 1A02616]